ncbi:hypothetical protein Vretimale_16021 [Volvox reticuliferus]|uniref:Uncharacterized protein n=1 Tax=Volvox reticuliferus TaxID=1737510 RepID=A0A8J4CF90_9CHLO|nr:hypothetical protein Vretifemale_9741 [Volvox reticuliferus]GIM12778.1 hypothetical protein Vretimale_16021 [Volvox reticuliferus]
MIFPYLILLGPIQELFRMHEFHHEGNQYWDYHPDVLNAGQRPWDHYVRHGRGEGRGWPSQAFKDKYVRNNRDVAEKWQGDPYRHYCLHGRGEGRLWPQD